MDDFRRIHMSVDDVREAYHRLDKAKYRLIPMEGTTDICEKLEVVKKVIDQLEKDIISLDKEGDL